MLEINGISRSELPGCSIETMPEPTPHAETRNTRPEWRAPAAGLAALLCAFLLLWPDGQNKSITSIVLSDNGNEGSDTLVTSLKPTSSATQVTWQVFSQDGALSYEVNAQAVKQYQSLQLMAVEQPLIRMTSEQQRPWLIQANQGEISRAHSTDVSDVPEAEQLDLRGNVQITQDQNDPRHTLSLFTPRLSIFPAQQRAVTDEPVVVRHAQFITTSHGLDLNLKTGTLSFAENDHTRVVSKLFLNQQSKGS